MAWLQPKPQGLKLNWRWQLALWLCILFLESEPIFRFTLENMPIKRPIFVHFDEAEIEANSAV
jgi:hypothetical protein